MHRVRDDGIVVVEGRGEVREQPANTYGHQAVVMNLSAVLHRHVRRQELGVVCASPIDVVLDAERALVVHDIVFVSLEPSSVALRLAGLLGAPRGRGPLRPLGVSG